MACIFYEMPYVFLRFPCVCRRNCIFSRKNLAVKINITYFVMLNIKLYRLLHNVTPKR